MGTHWHTLAHIGTGDITLSHIGTHWHRRHHIGTHWHTLAHIGTGDITLSHASSLIADQSPTSQSRESKGKGADANHQRFRASLLVQEERRCALFERGTALFLVILCFNTSGSGNQKKRMVLLKWVWQKK